MDSDQRDSARKKREFSIYSKKAVRIKENVNKNIPDLTKGFVSK
jgi:hypothetical protein